MGRKTTQQFWTRCSMNLPISAHGRGHRCSCKCPWHLQMNPLGCPYARAAVDAEGPVCHSNRAPTIKAGRVRRGHSNLSIGEQVGSVLEAYQRTDSGASKPHRREGDEMSDKYEYITSGVHQLVHE